jgi:hypothetical protein
MIIGSSFGTTVMNYDFNGIPAGTVVQANLAQYDFTSDQAYVGSNAVANTLAFNLKSSSADYIVRDKGGAYANALYLKTMNTANADFGIYLQKIDFTDGGANAANVTTVSWSFDILGYDSNGNLDPSAWTVKVRTDNTSQNLNVSDANHQRRDLDDYQRLLQHSGRNGRRGRRHPDQYGSRRLYQRRRYLYRQPDRRRHHHS